MKKKQDFASIKAVSSRIIAAEFSQRGIRVEHLNPFIRGDAFLRLTFRRHVEFVFGTKSSLTTSAANLACSSKALTKCFLAEKELTATQGRLFPCAAREEIQAYAAKLGFPCVLKKNDGSKGHKVFVGVRSRSQCDELVAECFREEKYVLVEKQFTGVEYRFLATRHKVLGVTLRDPANVTGDGQCTVRELIARKNETKLAKYRIKLDRVAEDYLHDHGIALEEVPAAGRKVQLRSNSNISTGGDALDFTDAVHAGFKKLAVRAVQSVPGLPYAGVDIMIAQDIEQLPRRRGYAIVELNANPDIFIHHHPQAGKPRDVAAGLADVIFPETKR
jgi:D-alanine-D-alanine ligase-like ATP-grasp enzyme